MSGPGKLKMPVPVEHDDVCWVLGVIDSHGAVHSKTMLFGDKGLSDTHATHWPNTLKRWRWAPGEGFFDVVGKEPDEFDMEEMDFIVRHLEAMGFKP